MQAKGCSDCECVQSVSGWPAPFLKVAMENDGKEKGTRVGKNWS